MHAPSALVAGAVITFGIAAFANLYLPSASPFVHQPALPEAAAVQYEHETPVVPADFEFESEEEPLPQVAEEISFEEVLEPTAAVATAPIQEPVVQPEPKPEPKIHREEPAKPRATTKPSTQSAPSSTAKKAPKKPPVKEEPPVQFTPKQSPAVFAKTGDTPLKNERTAGGAGLSISAVAGDRAWVRIGDSRTIAVKTGDVVPNAGRVKSVTADSVVFDSGLVLRVSQ